MIITFEGVRGSGMTLSAVAIAFIEWKRTGKPMVSGKALEPGSYKYLDKEMPMEEKPKIRGGK